MNKRQRKDLAKIQARIDGVVSSIEDIKSDIEDIKNEEDEKYENLPEGLQDSEMGEGLMESSEMLESIMDDIDCAIDQLVDVKDSMEDLL